MRQNRFSSRVAWLSVFCVLYFAGKVFLGEKMPNTQQVGEIVALAAVVYGIFNDPTDKNNY